jgi:hypothetical protein
VSHINLANLIPEKIGNSDELSRSSRGTPKGR